MNRTRTLVLVVIVFVAACGVAWVKVRQANDRLEMRVRAARAAHADVVRRHDENAALRRIIERARTDADGARRDMDQDVERARSEVADLEQQAQQRYETKVAAQRAAEMALTQNRDLTKGPVLVENCGNVGRATAVDAFQTLVWASARGDDETVAQLIAVNGAARDTMQAILAALPEAERAKYPTPERFIALYVADNVTNVAAVQVLKQTQPDSEHTLLEIARLDGKTTDLVMERGSTGWQIAIDANAAKKIGRYLIGATAPKH